MKYITDSDRNYIENKYHRQDQPFDPFDRLHYHGYEYDASTGYDDAQMQAGLEEVYSEVKKLDHALAKAKGFAFVLDHARIDVNPHDYFIGLYNWGRPLHDLFYKKWHDEIFGTMPDVCEKKEDLIESGTADMWLDTEHVVPNWMDILSLGFPGLLKRVQHYREMHKKNGTLTEKERAFFDSIQIEYEAIIRFVKRLYAYAITKNDEKSQLVAASLKTLSEGAPKTTLDALEMMYIYFLCSESVDQYQTRSLGNGLDRTLYRFYKSDIENGIFSRNEIKTFLAHFFMQFSAIDNYWGHPFYLCGTDFDNKTDITDITYDILDVYESLDIYNPKIQVKIDFDTPQELIDRVLTIIRSGKTSFVFCCMPGIIKSLMSCYGVTYEEARDVDISGCNEMHIRADEACMISSIPNIAKAVTYVFNNGIDTVTGKQLGAATGDVTAFKSFAEFYDAFLKQMAYLFDTVINMARRYEKYVAEINPSVMLSGTMERSLQKKVDAYGFGVKYPTSAILPGGFATAVDSVLAVKELVFDKGETTLSELKEALDANWEGYEELRLKALQAEHKYGNADKQADMYASAIFRWLSMYINGKKNSRGGVYKVGVPSTLHFILQGKVTEATPDGRKMGEEFSKNSAPVIGMERKGVTAMIRSALSTEPYMFSEAYVLDVMLHPSAVSGEDGLNAMRGLLMNYMKNGGVSIQFNIFSPDMLYDAQANPDKYKNLQVRVSGWNVLWNNMSKEEQDAYIIRAKSIEG